MITKPIKKTVKKTVKKPVIPPEILVKLKRVKAKFFKDETVKIVKEIYLELFKEDKEKYKDNKWSDLVHHKRALTKMKNKKKSEKLGGAVDKYYGVIFADSKIRDLSNNKRAKIIQIYGNDPQRALDEELIMIRKATNPQTKEIEKVPLLDEIGGIIPRDNVEFGTKKSGTKFKNPNFGKAIARAYRKNVIGVCSNLQGIKGVFIQELRDRAVDLEIPTNVLVKFSGKTLGTEVITLDTNKYVDKELLEEMINTLKLDIEEGIITEDYAKSMEEHYAKLLLLDDGGEAGTKIETTLFKLRSTKGTTFIKVENEAEFENVDFPMKNDVELDINLIYKEYFYPFTSDCSNLLKYHGDNRYIDGDTEKINWNEFVCLQDVNLIQINMEASMGGNYTLYVEDESLFNKDVSHLDTDIDAIKLLVPSNMNLNFAQDSKLNIIGSPVQFQAQDDEREDLWETEIVTDEAGETEEIKIPVMGYPLIMVHGIYPIPEYMVEVETFDLTEEEDEIEVEKKPKEAVFTKKQEQSEEEDMKGAIKIVNDIEEELELEAKKKLDKEPEEPEEPEEINDEDEVVDESLW